MDEIKKIKVTTKPAHRQRGSVKQKPYYDINKERDTLPKQNSPSNFQSKLNSNNKIIDFREMIPKLLNKINAKSSQKNNTFLDNISYGNNSNSSEINDDNESPGFNASNKNSNSKKVYIIEKSEEEKEYKNQEIAATFKQKRKIEKSPTVIYRKYSKEKNDSLVLRLHKYFFQDGELENIDTLIKYNINKIKINNTEDISTKSIDINNNKNINDFDYLNIKQEVITLMDYFARAFDRGNKNDLTLAIKDLNKFAEKYKFDYVTQLTLDWILKLQDKKYDKCELKYIGYYNQIRDIMDKMLKELKKKADLIIISQQKKKKDGQNENSNNNINNVELTMPISNALLKKNSINKEDLLKTKEIVPIKIDIEVNHNLNINEVEEILKNLDEGNFVNLGCRGNATNTKKLLHKLNANRNDELEAYSYPFKEDNLCHIF